MSAAHENVTVALARRRIRRLASTSYLFIVRGMHQEPPIASNFAAGTLQVYGGIGGDDLKPPRGSNS
jgi:hypothetical protein